MWGRKNATTTTLTCMTAAEKASLRGEVTITSTYSSDGMWRYYYNTTWYAIRGLGVGDWGLGGVKKLSTPPRGGEALLFLFLPSTNFFLLRVVSPGRHSAARSQHPGIYDDEREENYVPHAVSRLQR